MSAHTHVCGGSVVRLFACVSAGVGVGVGMGVGVGVGMGVGVCTCTCLLIVFVSMVGLVYTITIVHAPNLHN